MKERVGDVKLIGLIIISITVSSINDHNTNQSSIILIASAATNAFAYGQ